MKKTTAKPIAVTAVRFTKSFETIPRRIEFDGISYDLLSSYKKLTVIGEEGEEIVVDVSDGTRRFRLLEQLETATWRLLSVSS